MRRVFDICHGCRRCFNLCESFPRLFDLVDNSPSGEVDGVSRKRFPPSSKPARCATCAFMTKCPYVPPHPFNLDFPHLMLRYRAMERRKARRISRRASLRIPIATARWRRRSRRSPTGQQDREQTDAGGGGEGRRIDRRAELPKFTMRTFVMSDKREPAASTTRRRVRETQVALYATCFTNYNQPHTGMAARKLLNHLGVETKVAYPACCGMPFLEQADLKRVAEQAESYRPVLVPLIEPGLRHRGADGELRVDAEVRMALDLAPDTKASKRLSQSDVRHRRICCRRGEEERAAGRHEADRRRRQRASRVPRPAQNMGPKAPKC